MQGSVVVEQLGKTFTTRERTGLFSSRRVEVAALHDVSFAIRPGEVFGLLGPNGAGKTTLVKCLVTLLLPSTGRAWVNGHRVGEADGAIRSTIGCMLASDRGLYWKLTGRENLAFFAALHHLRRGAVERRLESLLGLFDLDDIADRAVESYSSGQRMKLSFAKALVNDAPMVFLDEPTSNLDPGAARELRAAVGALQQRARTVILTTHNMSEAEELCDRVAVVDRGRILALGTVRELKASLRRREVIRVEGVIPVAASAAVARLPGAEQVALEPLDGRSQMTVVARDDDVGFLPQLIATLGAHQAVIHRIAPEEPTLEDVFLKHTGHAFATKQARRLERAR